MNINIKTLKEKFTGYSWPDLYLLVFLLPLIINPWGFSFYEMPKVFYLRLVIGIALLVVTAVFLKEGKAGLIWDKNTALITGAWCVSLVLATIFSIAPERSLWGSYPRVQGLVTQVFYLLHFVLLLHYVQGKGALRKLLTGIYWVSIIAAIYGVLQKFGLTLFAGEANPGFLGRIFSTFGHPNFLGQYLLVPLWLSLYFFKEEKTKKLFHGAIFLLFLGTLILTENRASILGFLISIGFYAAFIGEKTRKYRTVIIALIIAAFSIFILAIAPSTRSLNSRFLLWQKALILSSQHVVLGSGLETIELNFPQVYPKELFAYEKINDQPDRMHNEFLDTLLMQGAFGALLYLMIIIQIFRVAMRRQNLKNQVVASFLCSFLAIIIANSFGFSLTSNYLIVSTVIAVIVSQCVAFHKFHIVQNFKTIILATVLILAMLFNIYNAFTMQIADDIFGNAIQSAAQNNNKKAMELLINANQMNPHQGYIFFLSGDFFANAGMASQSEFLLNSARLFLDTSYQFDGPNYSYFLEVARIEAGKKNLDASTKAFQEAHSLAPSNPIVLQEWSKVLFAVGDYKQTVKVLEDYLQLLPAYWQWTQQLAQKSHEDQETYRIFFKNAPDFWLVYKNLIAAYEKLGDREKAEYYRQFLPAGV